MQATPLSHKFAHTIEQVYQHPASHNLEWHDVLALVEHLGSVEEKGNGHLAFTVNGVSAGFQRPQGKDVAGVEEILDLRRFLESSGYGANGKSAADAKLRLLAIIDQKEARVFRSEDSDSVPERLHPYDPHGMMRLLKHTEGSDIDAQSPENLTYYKSIAETLVDANEILLMGHGTGASSAMTHLKDFLAAHHPEIAGKIVGSLTVDVEALTEGEMLREARSFFAAHTGDGSDAREDVK